MSNVITNILYLTGEAQRIQALKAAVQDDELGYGSFDFNKVIPTPPHIFQDPIPFEELRNRNAPNWYNWNRNNWGCRDNAYGFAKLSERATPRHLLFQVGWSPPHKVIQQLSKMFPDIQVEHLWADDNVGYNCGHRNYLAGEYTELLLPDGSQEAYEFAALVLNTDVEQSRNMINEEELEELRL